MKFIIVLLLISVNGILAMYEMAVVSSHKIKLKNAARKGSKAASRVVKMTTELEKILSTIQVGITLIGIVSGAYGGIALAGEVVPLFEQIPALKDSAFQAATVTVVAIITYLSLVIGELVPKSVALNNPEKIAMIFSGPMIFLSKVFYPFVWFLSISTRFFNKLFGISSGKEKPLTEDEIKMLLIQSYEQGVINKEESRMLKEVLRFGDKRTFELMTPRKNIIYINTDDSKEKVLQIIKTHQFSRYMLCENDIEIITGIIHIKDLIGLLNGRKDWDLRDIAQEPVFIPENLHIIKALELLKKEKKSFGIVVNEYGGVEGLITLHDLAENIFGEILEENEEPHMDILKRKDGTLLVNASMLIDDFLDQMDMEEKSEFEKEGFATLGGFAMYILDRIPTEGDTFEYAGLHFEIIDMDGSRVDKILVTLSDSLRK